MSRSPPERAAEPDVPIRRAPDLPSTLRSGLALLTLLAGCGSVAPAQSAVEVADTVAGVEVSPDVGIACLDVNPKKVQFGGKMVGGTQVLPLALMSCGTRALEVTAIRFAAGSNPRFSLEYGKGGQPTTEKPLVIQVDGQATVNIAFAPSSSIPFGPDGQPMFDKGTVVIDSNAPESQVEIEVTAFGPSEACPTAVIEVEQGEKVKPQTSLHFRGDLSTAPIGAIASWAWAVKPPSGSASVFVPSDTFPNPTFEVNVAGSYEFSLNAWDDDGVKSCIPAVADVLVVPDAALHVELTWHTPGDPDESDQGPEAGADLDLHVQDDAQPKEGADSDDDGQPDGWFTKHDCWWFAPSPGWGAVLTREDKDGAGPEIVQIAEPKATTYRVAVHGGWSDHGYGPSVATLRVYLNGALAFDAQAELAAKDLWVVATIDGSNGKITPVDTVVANFPPNNFFWP